MAKKKLKLVASNQKNPTVNLKEGMKIEVVTIQLVESTLKKAKKSGARLCGGTSTCLALVEVGE
jgi:hypothetical protein